MASMIATSMVVAPEEDKLEKFGELLVDAIMTPSEDSPDYYPNTTLGSDYGPDRVLSDAAEAAGLKCQFPWKTTMWVYGDSVSVSYGYGTEAERHYLLENGNWLITTLCGSDIDKIKKFAVDSTLPEFNIETKERHESSR
tara:strand:- start:22071 stop:22490 length:420 start_codon:yes stop_codon:yes gene_type:complete